VDLLDLPSYSNSDGCGQFLRSRTMTIYWILHNPAVLRFVARGRLSASEERRCRCRSRHTTSAKSSSSRCFHPALRLLLLTLNCCLSLVFRLRSRHQDAEQSEWRRRSKASFVFDGFLSARSERSYRGGLLATTIRTPASSQSPLDSVCLC